MRGSQFTDSGIGVCDICFQGVPAYLETVGNNVELRKTCGIHGVQAGVYSTDLKYFELCQAVARAAPGSPVSGSQAPLKARQNKANVNGSSYLAAAILELLHECDMACPTCSAESFPGAGRIKELGVVNRMLKASQSQSLLPPVIMLSGGEPTLHPRFSEILSMVVKSQAPRIFLVTNGVRLANEKGFAEELSVIGSRLEIYLQFDSLRPV